MRNTFYTTAEKAWGGMLTAIASAQESIYLEMYTLVDNTPGYDFFALLKRKAQAGVRVKVIIDSLGSSDLKSQTVTAVRAANVELLLFSYWLRRTHKKILIVDEKVAFVGGVNIHKLFRKWNDLQIRLTGPIVKGITRSFARTYALCGGKDTHLLAFNGKKNILGKTKLWILEHWKADGRVLLKQYYKTNISQAQKTITIVTPYFAPHRWLIGMLHQAVMRGVTVHILLPEQSDHWTMDRVSYFYMERLHKLGIIFYLSKQMNHAKTMLIDNREGLVGSNNIDPMSFHYNIEAGVFFQDKEMVRELKTIIETWKGKSVVFDPATKKPQWFDYLISPFMRIFQSML
ncbi:MAG: phosphatidylserine/phosphatidylglycerophosphate/cardiolipin synthase family protein [Candidatus Kerfeldbacteria bacterium]|nr:phosphatidylserine/phosphatidylglycerophosphate/cardiolipin synthase family protein [Candidatus Kerfeldbacteria bacterium]